ncbi:acetylcholinesterase-1-like [Uloborus diversus]|uniref:acetylcholinesterase-1-like n=1 Tax=Uloborus diversus TaxID=327109 RepID=UPI0024092477|nr:acetylcholinesterase-1-like [Uloborus diversus]
MGKSATYNGSPLREFLGIPFAQPPIGDLRFRKPLPLSPQSNILYAQTMPPACPQYVPYDYPWYDNMPLKSEDCLYLNIWAPKSATQEKKAVMFWIYGGGFTYGSNRIVVYNGKVLAAEKDVIVVIPNYRVGVLGFLTSESELAPGNMGLYDILEALKWVNENIDYFGGNRNQITIFGESAGAIAAGLFCVSPLTKNLFQRVIMESRSHAEYSDENKKSNLRLGQRLAEAVGCANNRTSLQKNPEAVVNCLKRIEADHLNRIVNSFNPTNITYFNFIHGDDMFPTNPKTSLINGNVHDISLFLGFNQDEGSVDLVALDKNYFGIFGEKNPFPNKTLASKYVLDGLKEFSYRNEAVVHYLGSLGEYDFQDVREQAYHALGDFRKACPMIYFGNSVARSGKDVYFYYFNHRSSVSAFAEWMGVNHFSEIQFVFGRPLSNPEYYTDQERELSRHMMTLWTNFAKYGNPSINTEKSTPSRRNYIHLKTSEWKSSYLENHEENCHFYQPFFGYPD